MGNESTPGPPNGLEVFELTASEDDRGSRLDRFIVSRLPHASRSRIERWIDEGHVDVDGRKAKPSHRLKGLESIVVRPPAPQPIGLEPQEMPLSILYEDSDLAAIDKPAGLVVHPAPGHPDHTLVNALLACIHDLGGVGDALRPGIVHRLDRDTTGVILVAKNDASFQSLARQVAARTIRKSYIALVYGSFRERAGTIDLPIGRHPKERKKMAVVPGGREALTRWRLTETLPRTSLLDVELVTGRTHQIRVHLTSAGHPVVGDLQYGSPQWKGISNRRLRQILASFPRQALHAARIEFAHPRTGLPTAVQAPLPADFAELLALLRKTAE